jgi:uncharacterized membrane protein YgcG
MIPGPFSRWLVSLVAAVGISLGSLVEAPSSIAETQAATPVLDRSGLLHPAMTAAIAGWLDSYRARTGNQVTIVVLEDLKGRNIEDWGAEVVTQDTSGARRNVVLLVAPTEQKAAIAVGEALKSRLAPDQAALIVETDFRSGFDADRLSGGIMKSVSDIIDVLDNGANASLRPHPGVLLLNKIVDGWPILLLFVGLVLVASILRTRYRRSVGERLLGRAKDMDTNDPAAIWWNDESRRN